MDIFYFFFYHVRRELHSGKTYLLNNPHKFTKFSLCLCCLHVNNVGYIVYIVHVLFIHKYRQPKSTHKSTSLFGMPHSDITQFGFNSQLGEEFQKFKIC